LKNAGTSPELSVSIRFFGNDLFYFHLDRPENFQQLYELFSGNNLNQDLLIAKNFLFFEQFKIQLELIHWN
jgi:hypothetical protein